VKTHHQKRDARGVYSENDGKRYSPLRGGKWKTVSSNVHSDDPENTAAKRDEERNIAGRATAAG